MLLKLQALRLMVKKVLMGRNSAVSKNHGIILARRFNGINPDLKDYYYTRAIAVRKQFAKNVKCLL